MRIKVFKLTEIANQVRPQGVRRPFSVEHIIVLKHVKTEFLVALDLLVRSRGDKSNDLLG
jgi:hypothetical protein